MKNDKEIYPICAFPLLPVKFMEALRICWDVLVATGLLFLKLKRFHYASIISRKARLNSILYCVLNGVIVEKRFEIPEYTASVKGIYLVFSHLSSESVREHTLDLVLCPTPYVREAFRRRLFKYVLVFWEDLSFENNFGFFLELPSFSSSILLFYTRP